MEILPALQLATVVGLCLAVGSYLLAGEFQRLNAEAADNG